MDTDGMFERIYLCIKEGRTNEVGANIDLIVSSGPGPMVLIKCASLLKVVDDEEGCDRILDIVADSVTDDNRFSIAVALRGLNRNADALAILSGMKENDSVLREKAASLLAVGDPSSSLGCIGRIVSPRAGDRVLRTEALCALGMHDDAYKEAERLVSDENGSYDSLVNLCATMMRAGRNKDALKTVRGYFKEDRKNADNLALGAYVMRVNGRTSVAAGYAHNALRLDPGHIGAMETMALCLVEKKKFTEAKLVAGAINEKDPGNPAAIRILDACRNASSGL